MWLADIRQDPITCNKLENSSRNLTESRDVDVYEDSLESKAL